MLLFDFGSSAVGKPSNSLNMHEGVNAICKNLSANHQMSSRWRDRILTGTTPLCTLSNTATPAVLYAATSVFSLQSTLLCYPKKKWVCLDYRLAALASARISFTAGAAEWLHSVQSLLYIRWLILTLRGTVLTLALPHLTLDTHTQPPETEQLTCRVTSEIDVSSRLHIDTSCSPSGRQWFHLIISRLTAWVHFFPPRRHIFHGRAAGRW